MIQKKKKDLMPARVKRAKKELEIVSHTFIRKRDSKFPDRIGGYCFDCGEWAEGQQFQCGHFEPSGSSGAILRYHPMNMNGQKGGCNVGYVQERVKINYTLAMIKKYGQDKLNRLRQLKYKTIKADIVFYETMVELYKKGNEEDIISYLESL